ncbi:MAG TPA: acyltransferase [Xanthobacteraceae bacterium]|nr:acyltransferase [Xanthobacteraceae bacterium]
MPQLDGLRGLCVIAVVYTHYWPKDYWPFGVFWAPLGVIGFFVLSGFLITSVLLRDLATAPTLPAAYGSFLARRALRLYPILLVVLLAASALHIGQTRETLAWHLFYLTNFYMAAISEWPVAFGHLYSLAVEEQFYLIWPLALFFLPRRLVPAALLLLVFTAIVFRIAWVAAGLGDTGMHVLTPAAFDALALGALLAFIKTKHKALPIIGLIGFSLWLASEWIVFPYRPDLNLIFFSVGTTGAAMFFMWAVARLADGVSGPVGAVFNNAVLRYIGIISYGIYLLHGFMPYFLGATGYYIPPSQFYPVATVATVVLAALSWHLLERPIIRAGRKIMSSRFAAQPVRTA